MRFAVNHNVSPQQPLDEFFDMVRALNVSQVEIRNDLEGAPIQDGTPPEIVRNAAIKAGVNILTINALYPFNVWTPELEGRATALADYAVPNCRAAMARRSPMRGPIFIPKSGWQSPPAASKRHCLRD